MYNIEILPLSQYDPDKDIILIYVDIGRMPPSRIPSYLEQYKKQLNPIFEKRGFETLYIARRNDRVSCEIHVDDKEVAERQEIIKEYDGKEEVEKLIGKIQYTEDQNNFDRAKSALDGVSIPSYSRPYDNFV